jgi:hypothetical protein
VGRLTDRRPQRAPVQHRQAGERVTRPRVDERIAVLR